MERSIYEFEKGDQITRLKPAKALWESMGGDRSYIGEKLIFQGIANGVIYLKRTNEIELKIFGDKLIELPMDIFSENWAYYQDPTTLFEDDDRTFFSYEDLENGGNQKLQDILLNMKDDFDDFVNNMDESFQENKSEDIIDFGDGIEGAIEKAVSEEKYELDARLLKIKNGEK